MLPPSASLVAFDSPVLIATAKAKTAKTAKPAAAPTASSPPKNQPASNGSADASSKTEDILNSILPPREWTEDGQLWVQYVSSTPATRLDVINLQEDLDRKLQQRQARETGICPVREELYVQAFDEIIRQVTINCAERGLLLLRVRDEIRMTIAAYQTLYESCIAFGMRKALLAEQYKVEMKNKIVQLEGETTDLNRQIEELKTKCDSTEKKEAERRALEEKKHQEEVQSLKKTNVQTKQELERILAPAQPPQKK
ncbi:hypothetical protein GUITHDRAFT_77405 [Guillardia theta CCMP2712]|uniref:Uncharacterized protein n=1 Tax=Guillardia theta (strain CCMP2712) TaxID=905079 RepID=L1IQL6_GUITC|nr:hypothetical protein GUITHDRAFT_77405 [Guillardia theta CCMP2712]EKX38174.1 hypothetical protein GUITHDRAFT_77405 [Guillardia theta CCMP2712]|eukprot:XP_005825154.1 hypothetical protein GUITHDRAFT_77405 [Guillardia theta CCMP2712]